MQRALLIAAGALLVAGIAFVVRIQTTLSYYDRAVLHVKLHRSGLDALAESLLSEPEIDFVAYSNDGGVIAGSPSKIRVDLSDPTRQKYETLFDRARLYFIAKHEAYSGHAFIELGSGSRFGRDFGVMLLYGPGPSSERCSEQYRNQDSGHCHFDLGGHWYLHYGWTTE